MEEEGDGAGRDIDGRQSSITTGASSTSGLFMVLWHGDGGSW